MVTDIKKIMGEDSYPFDLEQVRSVYEIHASMSMALLIPRSSVSLPSGVHRHEHYEFFIPVSTPLVSIIDKKILPIGKNQLLPINSGQAHGLADPVAGLYCMGFHIDRGFLLETARHVYGRKEVTFQNKGVLPGRQLLNLLRLFIEESRFRQAGYAFILESLSVQIVVYVLRMCKNNLASPDIPKVRGGKENIRRAEEFLRENITSRYSLEEVSRAANLSTYHFIRVFRSVTGKTPYEYLLDAKIEKARELLRSGKMTVTEVCLACGFNNVSHFTSTFKKKVGVTPSRYRN